MKSETTLKKIRVLSSLKVCEDMNVAISVDTYRRHLRGGYWLPVQKSLQIYTCHPHVEWTGCSSSAARTDYVDYNHCICKDTPTRIIVFICYVRILLRHYGMMKDVSDRQLCAGHIRRCEACVHAMTDVQMDEQTEAVLLVGTSNAFNSLNREAAVRNIRTEPLPTLSKDCG